MLGMDGRVCIARHCFMTPQITTITTQWLDLWHHKFYYISMVIYSFLQFKSQFTWNFYVQTWKFNTSRQNSHYEITIQIFVTAVSCSTAGQTLCNYSAFISCAVSYFMHNLSLIYIEIYVKYYYKHCA